MCSSLFSSDKCLSSTLLQLHFSSFSQLSDESGKSTAEYNLALLKEKIANSSPKAVLKDVSQTDLSLSSVNRLVDERLAQKNAAESAASANLSLIVNDSSANDSSRCSLVSGRRDLDLENAFYDVFEKFYATQRAYGVHLNPNG